MTSKKNTPVTADITLTAKWEINKYTVTFDSYGGSKVDPQVVEYGLYAQEPEEPTRKGFTFAYWYLDDENEAYDFENTPVTADITLTAKVEHQQVYRRFQYGRRHACSARAGSGIRPHRDRACCSREDRLYLRRLAGIWAMKV